MTPKKFFISTAIPYVNAEPHIGFALEIIQADVVARYHRQRGDNVFFLTGTDENSFKIARSAIDKGLSPKDLVDKNSKKFYELKKILNLSFDDFIRTTEERHKRGAQKFWGKLQKKDIYVDTWIGWYCVGCEAYYQEKDLIDGNKCPEHLKPVEFVEEKNYFFRINPYKEKLKDLIRSDGLKIIPDNRRQEVFNLLEEFHDFNISRNKKYEWGVSVPNDSSQIIYPWVEALTNYINGVGYMDNLDKFKTWWEDPDTKIIHVLGKGIIKFHAIYWPAMLLSAGIRLPNTIFAHGYLTIKGQKISKSLGNVISPQEVVSKYGTDPARYFLLREIPSYEDGDFTYEKFRQRYNADLANGLGNYNSRVLTLAKRDPKLRIPDEKIVNDKVEAIKTIVDQKIEEFKLNEAIAAVWELISFGDKYLNENEVWKISDPDKKSKKLANLLFVLISVAELLKPFLPQTSEKILSQLEVKGDKYKVKKIETLFPRI
ncbi:methionine--tRNA ligase [Candidatus Wolfebacteria bacterium CG03_land_8_20_14_0_80_36_15]|uniref:Methionine--tRNA ligase n=1 Tax=Candidatus Wolfebacteria bacterium CG03_land_8_20_14_0_80_36_15 TaxID=1975067 RepID=A0A2M7B7Z8_9BACT|nr:MAG: methionine--tRNA ligase [Candidatus Wolfebacteria bacterium CG03_land_8_20_14_0_80_36_15]